MSYMLSSDGHSITCHQCGLTSHNQNDVVNRYCGHCHVFHDDMAAFNAFADAVLAHRPKPKSEPAKKRKP
jgi:hypothetical protein